MRRATVGGAATGSAARFASFYRGTVEGITAEVLRAFFATVADSRPSTRARKQEALASFLTGAYQADHAALCGSACLAPAAHFRMRGQEDMVYDANADRLLMDKYPSHTRLTAH
jgi:hypothetical protein